MHALCVLLTLSCASALLGPSFVAVKPRRPSSFEQQQAVGHLERGLRLRKWAFEQQHAIEHLERDLRGDLARVAQKFKGGLLPFLEDIQDLHVTEVDGDHIALAVVYCDHRDDTCVAVDVPIEFTRHVDTEEELDEMIYELESEGFDAAAATPPKRRGPPLDPAYVETMASFSRVMTESFQDELVGYMRAFGGSSVPRGASLVGRCEMAELSPDGFAVRARVAVPGAALATTIDVPVFFSRECWSARALQQELLRLSEQAVRATAPASSL